MSFLGGNGIIQQAADVPLIFLQPLNLREFTVPHLKDLIHNCLATESQGHGMTFIVIYAQNTLISYHIEAFVKTDVACPFASVG